MVSLTLVWRSMASGRPLWGFAMRFSVRGCGPGLTPEGRLVLFRANPHAEEPRQSRPERAEWLRSLVRCETVEHRPTERIVDLTLRVPKLEALWRWARPAAAMSDVGKRAV